MTKLYYRLNSGLNDVNYKFYPIEDDVHSHINDYERDHYKSIYYYTEDQVEEASQIITVKSQKTGNNYNRIRGVGNVTDSVTGTRYRTIEDVKTNILAWDFDSSNIELSQQDTRKLYQKLIDSGIKDNEIQVSFSGGKGFSLVLETDTLMTPDEVRTICSVLADGLATFDPKIYNPSRIFRIPLTKHSSGLYKTPIPSETLLNYDVDTIKELATEKLSPEDIAGVYSKTKLPKKFRELKLITEKLKTKTDKIIDPSITNLDWSNKPKFLSPEKYVLHSALGYGEGERHDTYMILASTYRAAGYSDFHARAMIKAIDEQHCLINKRESFDEDELWFNIIGTVYSESWQGGTYGPGHPILTRIADQIPSYLNREKKKGLIQNGDVFDKFQKFAIDIDKNTLKLGVSDFDKDIRMLAGTTVGILGTPGSGKTSLALNMLKNNSAKGEKSIFFSLDMNESLVALTQMRQATGLSNEQIFKMVKDMPEEFELAKVKSMKAYENVDYSFRFGLTPADIREDIEKCEKDSGEKVRLVVVDYLENVQSGYSDPTVGAGVVAQQLANVAAEMEVLIVILLQTQKSTKPGESIQTMRQIKGASVIEQSLSVALGVHREGQILAYKDYDNSMTVNILKNRFGPLGSTNMYFSGLKAEVRNMTKDEKKTLDFLKDLKKEDKEEKEKEKNSGWGY